MKKYIPYILSAWLILGFTLFESEKAFSQTATLNTDSTYVSGITSGRARSLVGTVAGLISVIVGWRAKRRFDSGAGSGKNGAMAALALGLICIALSVVHLSNSYSAALGSGSGKAGAYVALVLGLIGTVLGSLVLRAKRK